MPSVSYNSQSFTQDARRLWLVGASIQYARVPVEEWAARIADARQAGFNTIETACPWALHEPRRGRFVFDEDADVARFVRLCAEADMRVILRVGPFVGGGFDRGGLPNWLLEDEGVRLREASEPFLERVSRYFRKLCGEIGEEQLTKGGPIVLLQIEHEWMCGHETEAERYLGEITRIIRECGIAVPLFNTNNLWTEPLGTIDAWRGETDLLANLRQLRCVQPDAPRLASAFERSTECVWGDDGAGVLAPTTVLRRLAEILASGAQPIVTPFHGGTNFGFLGGRLPGRGGGVTTSGAAAPMLGEAGARGERYAMVRRLVTFASQFEHVFADLDPDYQPAVLDPALLDTKPATGSAARRRAPAVSVVPLRGAGGRVVFVFGEPGARGTTLLLDTGVRLPIDLGDQPVGWFILETDLHGRGHLDYANLCPFAIVDRSVIVLVGAKGAPGIFSINGTPLQATVPTGAKPVVVTYQDLHFVICNQAQADVTFHDGQAVYVGVAGLDDEGRPIPAGGSSKAWRIDAADGLQPLTFDDEVRARAVRRPHSTTVKEWRAAPAADYATGASPRFASLSGPQSLAACGAMTGYGWYRTEIKMTSAGKRRLHAPQSGDRVHLYVNGELAGVLGDGPGATEGPWSLSLPKGVSTITALVDNLGGFAGGNELDRRAGLRGHLYEVKAMRSMRPKKIETEPVSPFDVRPFIVGAAAGQRSAASQITWSFTHARKAPILVEVVGADATGTFLLNDQAVAYHAGATGSRGMRLLLEPGVTEAFKRGKNVLRFAPDPGQEDLVPSLLQAMTFWECATNVTAKSPWAFAKWEPPPETRFRPETATAAAGLKGQPCWWRGRFAWRDDGLPVWLDLKGLTKGHVSVNGRDAGRFFVATADGKAVGPQRRLLLPRPWLRADATNELVLFDEHGGSPHAARIVYRRDGDLD